MMWRRNGGSRRQLLLPLIVAAPFFAGCNQSQTGAAAAPQAAPSIALSDCRVKDFDSLARCATVSVPEDHAKPEGKRIEIFVAVLPALARRPEADPLFLFAGGPGQAASDLGRIASAFGDVRKLRPIVLVDQRGTGKSKTLTCDLASGAKAKDPLVEVLNSDVKALEKDWAKCVSTMKGSPATHRTDDYIDDLELIRKGLGYGQINVWGGSYGSRVALRYMKRFPASIRTAVVDGVAPTTLRLPDDAMSNSEAQLKEALSACAASEACTKAYPALSSTLDSLLERLRSSPQTVTFAHPATGKPLTGAVSDRTVISLLWPLLYQPEASRMIPSLIEAANAGNFAPLAATTTAGATTESDISVVQRFAVMCAEDMLGRSPPAMQRFKALSDMFYSFCRDLPHGRVEAEFFEPTVSDIPTLLFSGSLDPVTPPAQGALVAKSLTQSKHIVVSGMGHIVSPMTCTRRIMGKFIAAGNIAAAADACEAELNLPRPLFYVSPLEARP
jgi:pimeloyl-ACP methyl ester carboxylesterase